MKRTRRNRSVLYDAAERFIEWLDDQVTASGRGSDIRELEVGPAASFWLGRLAPEEAVIERGLGERGERLDPCAMGIRVLASGPPPWALTASVRARAWLHQGERRWIKSEAIEVRVPIRLIRRGGYEETFGRHEIEAAMAGVSCAGLSAEVRVEVRSKRGQNELTILVVNSSPKEHVTLRDTNLYEVELEIEGCETTPFVLESLPDSFRYDRRIDAYGVNCGVERTDQGTFRTLDTVVSHRGRPEYWNVETTAPDLRFSTLATNPLPSLRQLVSAVSDWGVAAWSEDTLTQRAQSEDWSVAMQSEAKQEAARFAEELVRLEDGLHLLQGRDDLRRAFRLMNEAIAHAAHERYAGWRPFQIGFLLTNLRCLIDRDSEARFADVIWFATGGGKTETYLALIVMAALLDRIEGKRAGVTAWSRFPLRMLSLQQTQRFADALAGAEIVRRREGLAGEPFSVGFLVGERGTPNRVPVEPEHDWDPDPDDDEMPARYQVLLLCPFCHCSSIEMGFDRLTWCLEHRCTNRDCVWDEQRLPFFITDDEIYRFLPTVVVGTLDKAASVGIQAAMRGLVGPPHGVCDRNGHGFTYAPRNSRPNGCLVPGCPGGRNPVPDDHRSYGPRFRLQDELHLLKDSLGAVDAHYEALLDHLQAELTGTQPKILASSATLSGYEHQVEVLYRRDARVFPLPGPAPSKNFWTHESTRLARRFVAVAPRGQTLEFTVDRMLTHLQAALRRLRADPDNVCKEAGIDPSYADDLLSFYGTDVVYGSTLRDLDAAMRSAETQVKVDGQLNTAMLTGRTPFEEVRSTLSRLEQCEGEFDERLHIVGASSMMSHGVDIDRLNVMVMLGLPLTTSEFIQTTARVGRRMPGLVYVIAKVARERDAAVFRSFEPFIKQGDRFVEPVPVTRRSRRVLERTLPGIELARLLHVHEPASLRALTTVKAFREYCERKGISAETEIPAVVSALGFSAALDERLEDDVQSWLEEYFRNLFDPVGDVRFPRDLCPGERRPMLSLRDVEEQAPVSGVLS
jgi:hypothetical protein